MSNYPDDFNYDAFARLHGEGPEAIAYENAIEREYLDLLSNITDDWKAPDAGLTQGQKFIDGLVYEQELDGTLYTALQAAAKHLKDRKAVTPEQVGQALIEALTKDLSAIAERNAADEE